MRWYDLDPDVSMAISMIECSALNVQIEIANFIINQVKERDKRTFNEYIIEQIKSNLLIVNIILKNNPFKPRTLKILLFIINIDLYLFINALFINEEFISDVFHSKDNNFFSFYQEQ